MWQQVSQLPIGACGGINMQSSSWLFERTPNTSSQSIQYSVDENKICVDVCVYSVCTVCVWCVCMACVCGV